MNLYVALAALALAATACNEQKPAETPAEKPAAEGQAATDQKPQAAAPAAPQMPKEIPAPPDVAKPPADAECTASKLCSKVLQPGTGTEKPEAKDTVLVHYTGWTTDGKMFDSSVARGQPARFPLGAVIPGWTEGVQLMTKGEKRRFWIPEELAYKGRPGAPQGMLVFDVELLDITKAPKPLPAPADVAKPPKDAKCEKSGLCSKVLEKGTGKEKPTATSRVKVDYTGWTTDGQMFDSSVTRGRPAEFPLDRVIPGWTEGLQLMTVGESRRLWIPETMAYKGRPGAPQGMLVFDVKLLEILPSAPRPTMPQMPPRPPPTGTQQQGTQQPGHEGHDHP